MRRNALVNIGFSLILFLMFVVGSFFLLVYGARGYKHGLEKEESRELNQIPFAYITTRMHQASSSEAVSIQEVEGNKVLVIKNEDSLICIYQKDQSLYELVTSDINQIDLSGGTKIYDVSDFDINYQNGYYEITLNDQEYKIGVR